MENDETDGKDGHIYRLKKIDEIQEILNAERDKRNEISIKYNRGVNIIGVIDVVYVYRKRFNTFSFHHHFTIRTCCARIKSRYTDGK